MHTLLDSTECNAIVLPQSFRELSRLSRLDYADWNETVVTSAIFHLLAAIRHAGTHENTLLAAKQVLAIIGDISEDDSLCTQFEQIDSDLGDDLGGFNSLFASLIEEEELSCIERLQLGFLPFEYQIKLKPIFNAATALSVLDYLNKRVSLNIAVPAACIILEAFVAYFRHSIGHSQAKYLVNSWMTERGCQPSICSTFAHFDLIKNFSVSNFHRFSSLESTIAFAVWVVAHYQSLGIALPNKAREACVVLLADDFLHESVAAF